MAGQNLDHGLKLKSELFISQAIFSTKEPSDTLASLAVRDTTTYVPLKFKTYYISYNSQASSILKPKFGCF